MDKDSLKVSFYDGSNGTYKCYKGKCYPFELKTHSELFERANDKELFKKSMRNLHCELEAYKIFKENNTDIDFDLYL